MLSDMVDTYNNGIQAAINKHAPQKTKKVKTSHQQPWFSDKIRDEIQIRCMKEGKFLADPTEYNFQTFYYQGCHVANIIKTARAEHYNNLIHEKKNDYKEVYNIVNSLLFRKKQSPLPKAENDYVLAEQFSEFFKDKIDTIMIQLKLTEAGQVNPNYIESQYEMEHRMQSFMPVFNSDISSIISSSPAKHCELDPLPMTMLQENINAFSGIIANIANTLL